MANYVEDRRAQECFTEGSLDKLLPDNSMARLIHGALARFDFSAFDALYKNDTGGQTALDPRHLCAVWILALLQKEHSARRLETLCGRDIEYRWLLGGAQVGKSTLAGFRKAHKERVCAIGAQVLVALGHNGLLPGEHLGTDGTVVRAASSRHSSKKRKSLESQLKRVQKLLEQRLQEEEAGPQSSAEASKAPLARRLRKVQEALRKMDALNLAKPDERLTLTEPDAALLKQKDGAFAPGYNLQATVDLQSGAIIHAEPVAAANDSGQLLPQVSQAQAALRAAKQAPEHAVTSVAADGAYHDTRQLDTLEKAGIACYVPDPNADRLPKGVTQEFAGGAFVYDEKNDRMQCPAGHPLFRRKHNNAKTAMVYQAKTEVCAACPFKPQCCPESKQGRCVNRSVHKAMLDTVAARLDTETGQQMKRARSVTCEGVFARFKRLFGWGRCSTWDKAGAAAELAWCQLAHNLMLLIGVWQPLAYHGIMEL